MYFNTKNRTVFSPKNPKLDDFYSFLEKHEPILGGSRFYDDLIDTYEELDSKLKEDNHEFAPTK